ncbi:Regulator of chromosome condensation [Phlyctochytrium planicorne]|nr:Regulator of chromosome condensation [Phlyctochytrium planicorne]
MGRPKRTVPTSPQEKTAVDGAGSPTRKRSVASKSADAAGGDMAAARRGRPPVAPELKKSVSKVAPFDRLLLRFNDPGEVFVVGSGDCGQLGMGPEETSKGRPKKLEYFLDKNIVDVAAGGLHNMALSSDGKLFSWGRSGEETVPLPVEGLDGVKIVRVVCGDSVTAALSDEGNVYAWGTFRNKNGVFGFRPEIEIQPVPFMIPELKRVIYLDAGANHIAAMTIDKKILTWGSGEQGQLGRRILPRSEKESSLIPRLLYFKPRGLSSNFESVYCGGYHTFILHESGAVFSFGLNNYGQLGLGDTDEHDTPELVEGLDASVGVEMITGAEHHSMLLDKSGKVYTFGRGEDGQLGTGNLESVSTPTGISEPEDVRFIAGNGAFSLALVKPEGNNLWMWGYGEMGQLSNNFEDAKEPFEVELKERHVYVAAAGGQHTVMLIKPKE